MHERSGNQAPAANGQKSSLDTKCRFEGHEKYLILWEHRGGEKSPKKRDDPPKKLGVDIKRFAIGVFSRCKPALDKVFFTFSTEFSTGVVAR